MTRLVSSNRADWLCPRRWAITATFTLVMMTSSASTAAAQTPCARVTVTADQPTTIIFTDDFETGTTVSWKEPPPTFRSTEILDLIFQVEIEGELQELQVLTLKINGPNGYLFRELTVPVTTAPSRHSKKVLLDGFPHPVRLAVVEKVGSKGMIELRFPVAGTSIVSSSVYGSWHVVPLIDGTPSSCAAESKRFILMP
jgi:hypothetical protein